MKDWVLLLTAIMQFITQVLILNDGRKTKKKGTKRSRRGKRK